MIEKFQITVTGARWRSDIGIEFLLITAGPFNGWLCRQDADGSWAPDYMPSEEIKQSILKNTGI